MNQQGVDTIAVLFTIKQRRCKMHRCIGNALHLDSTLPGNTVLW